MMQLHRQALVAFLAFALAGCSWFPWNKTEDYKGAQARRGQPLEVPPQLSAPTTDDRYAIPDPHSQTTYSDYAKQAGRPQAPQGSAGPAVLPVIKDARMERDRDSRWLVVKGDPDKVWAAVREFWLAAGYQLTRESPEVGIMETDWHDDPSQTPQDFVHRMIGKYVKGMASSPRRDKFRTRLERGLQPGTTEVFVSDHAMEEIYTNAEQDRVAWQPLPVDPEREAEMLSRIAVSMGADQTQVAAAIGKAPAGRVSEAAARAAAQPLQNAVLENGGAGPLVVNDGFDRAWRRVGLALDRVGFTVEDRDRSKGLFFVRYIDPDAAASAEAKRGILDDILFWRSKPNGAKPQYRILVSDAGANSSQVLVQKSTGATDTSPTGKKILAVLYEQLK